ncbi:hypothetical protein J0X14_12135 [Muricauda sp. CAU 1633]|uniref:hypothetical protein n=1 Tax=Allomuricauda sp. CAU 1633 TaxID=2816036 RepID=UPI001A8FA9BF|nr:hypothetical protein [Muricauda sp. CAU 1633]MBO0323048.1 hypothetical protein [Muricauda sp. CAU 1633]
MQNIPNPAVILAIVLNGLIFIIYLILKNNGEKGRLFSGAVFTNPIKLFRLAKRTENNGIKFIYFSLVFAIPILTVLFVFSAFTQMSEFINHDECEYQEYFRNREWNGKIVDKYLDEENHLYQTISIKNDSGIYKIQDGILSDYNNYELIEIGDSISKTKGELTAKLYKPNKKTELKSDFDCEK